MIAIVTNSSMSVKPRREWRVVSDINDFRCD
jgi:hypothetical protein